MSYYKQPSFIMPFFPWFEEHFGGTSRAWYRPCVNMVAELFQDLALSEPQPVLLSSDAEDDV